MLSNQKIFERYLEKDEKILWDSKPYVKYYLIVDNPKLWLFLSAILSVFMGFLICLLFMYKFWEQKENFHSLLYIIILIFFVINSLYAFFLLKGVFDRKSLRNTEYFISNKQIFSIITYKKLFTEDYKEIVNIPLNRIEYYFVVEKKIKGHILYDVIFKIKVETIEDWQNMKLKCTKMQDYKLKNQFPVQLVRDDRWSEIPMISIEKMKNVISFVQMNVILHNELGIKYLESPPLTWNIWTMGEFHNPNGEKF